LRPGRETRGELAALRVDHARHQTDGDSDTTDSDATDSDATESDATDSDDTPPARPIEDEVR
jgi:hypothetical protein